MTLTYFFSGHLDLTDDEFERHYVPKLAAAIEEGAGFVVGDARGCDALVQAFLATRVTSERVRVFHMFVGTLQRRRICDGGRLRQGRGA